MKEFLWKALAQVLVQPVVTALLLRQAKKTPYLHIRSPAGDSVYMERYWLLNPYDRKTNKPRWSWLPFSVRIHHIHRPDYDAHCHDHPWDARTIILRGWYKEKRLATGEHRDRIIEACLEPHEKLTADRSKIEASEYLTRLPGDTAPLKFGEYHKIDKVSPGGAITLFITWKYQGKWGFWVDGAKVYWKTYLGIPDDGDLPNAAPTNRPARGPSEGTVRFSGSPGREGCAWSPDGKHMSFGGMVEQPDGSLRQEERCICCGEEL